MSDPKSSAPAKRPRGRPKGTGQGRSKESYNLSLDVEVVAWLKAQASPSDTANRHLRAAMEAETAPPTKPSRRR